MSRPMRIGIIDSGVNLTHSHIGNIAGGTTIAPRRRESSYVDRLGHGTAVAALIHARAPQAELFAVKVFQDRLITNLQTLLFAIDWCLDNGMDLINLSLGTTNGEHRAAFETAVARVQSKGKGIVSAYEMLGVPALPGSLAGVVAVVADSSREPGEHFVESRDGKNVVTACPYPREIPGVPRERNLHGISFAVAHVTATLAQLSEPGAAITDWESVLPRLSKASTSTRRSQFAARV